MAQTIKVPQSNDMGSATSSSGGSLKAQAIGVVKVAIGDVVAVNASGVACKLQPGDKVFPNDIIQTGELGSVQIEFTNGQLAGLGRVSSLLLDTDVFDPGRAQAAGDDVSKIQDLIAAGADPTQVTEASAAGGTQEDQRHGIVEVNQSMNSGIATGHDSDGISSFQQTLGTNQTGVSGQQIRAGVTTGYNTAGIAGQETQAHQSSDSQNSRGKSSTSEPAPTEVAHEPARPTEATHEPAATPEAPHAPAPPQEAVYVPPTPPEVAGVTNDSTPLISGVAPAGSTVTVDVHSLPQHFVLQADARGNWSLTPATLDEGLHHVWTSVSDASGHHSTTLETTFVVDTIKPVSNAVVLSSEDGKGIFEGGKTITGNLGPATDDGTSISYTLLNPTPGLTVGSDGSFQFDPANPAYQHLAAGDTITTTAVYQVGDLAGNVSSNTVTITLTGTNDAPVVAAQTASAIEGGTRVVVDALTDATDVDDHAMLTVVDVPTDLPPGVSYNDAQHRFELDPGNAEYDSLAQGSSVTFSVSYGVSDGTATTPATLTFTVTGSNDAPIVTATADTTIESGGQPVSIDALVNTSDVDAGSALSVVNIPETLPAGVSYDVSNHSFVIDPAAYSSLQNGDSTTVTVAYGVSDGVDVTPVSAVFTVVGTATPAAPIITVTSASGTEETTAVSGTLSTNGISSGFEPQSGIEGSYGNFSIDANGTWTYTLAPADQSLAGGQHATESFSVVSADGSSSSQVTVNILGINDKPTITGSQTNSGSEDQSITGTLTISDADRGQSLFVAESIVGSYGDFTVDAQGNWKFEPNDAAQALNLTDEARSETFTVTSLDGTAQQNVVVTITGANDAPVISTTSGTSGTPNDDATVTGTIVVSDVDENSSMTFSVANDGAGKFGNLSVDEAGNWTYSLDQNGDAYQRLGEGDTGTDSFTITVADGQGGSASQVITINVTGTNDVPTVAAQTGTATEGGSAVAVAALTGAADADAGASLSVVVPATLPDGVSYDADSKSFVLDPTHAAFNALASGATTTVVVNYGISDGLAVTPNTLSFTVTGTNDAATITGIATGSVAEIGIGVQASATATGNLNSTDVDNPADAWTAVNSPMASTYGTYTVTPDGVWSYNLDNTNSTVNALNSGQSLTDSFTVSTVDGTPQTVTIAIAGTNDLVSGEGDDDDGEQHAGDDDDGEQHAGGDHGNASDDANILHVADADGGGSLTEAGNGTWIYANGNDQYVSSIHSIATSNTVNGTDGTDTGQGSNQSGNGDLTGTSANDRINGLGGDDTLEGKNGDDILNGGSGNDILVGGPGDDLLYGGSGRDTLEGGQGNDILVGGAGADIMSGGDANDGSDTFKYEGLSDLVDVGSGDVITNFTVADVGNKGDVLDLHDLLGQGGVLSFDTVTHDGNKTTVSLRIDTDGSGPHASVPLATITMTGLGENATAADIMRTLLENHELKL